MPPHHGHHFASAETCRIDNDLCSNLAFVGGYYPLAVGLLFQAGYAGVAANGGAQQAGLSGQGLGELGRVNVAIEWVPQRALDVVGFNQGIAIFEFAGRQNFVFQSVSPAHALNMVKFIHAVAPVGQTHRTCQVVIDGVLRRRR